MYFRKKLCLGLICPQDFFPEGFCTGIQVQYIFAKYSPAFLCLCVSSELGSSRAPVHSVSVHFIQMTDADTP